MNTILKKQTTYLAVLLLVLLLGCKETELVPPLPLPKAGFSFSISNQGFLPANVNFTSTSIHAETYEWSFDDGNVSMDENPKNTFLVARTYLVKLTVANDAGKDSVSMPVVITLNKPVANFDFTLSNSGAMPCNVNFINLSSGAETWGWNFGDRTSSDYNAVNTYSESKTFEVKLVVANAAGMDSIVKQIRIPKINYSVRIFLITPTDRRYNQDYFDAIKMCALNLQEYYKQQNEGKTFILNNPMIDTLRGLHTYKWYNEYNGPHSGSDPRFYGFYNTLHELQNVIGSDLNTTLYMNAVYVAAPGGGAGNLGLCAMGDQDLDGLLGLNPTDRNINRWIGGSGHEWGHGFGLNHPTDPDAPPAIMGPGLYNYPNCVLLPDDKKILSASAFFK